LQFTGEEIGYGFSTNLLGRQFTNRLARKKVRLPFLMIKGPKAVFFEEKLSSLLYECMFIMIIYA
jgi:hypothetical protein